jgi:predicted metal-dependent peptidase
MEFLKSVVEKLGFDNETLSKIENNEVTIDDAVTGYVSKLEKTVDDAIKQGLENEREADSEKTKEERTIAEKGRGKGGSSIRDRIEVEILSQTDWASIFENRLTEYSDENAQYIPYNRRFVSGIKSPTGRLPDKVQERDTLPALNLIIDTSSSLGYNELAVILSEVGKALESAKISELNILLWASTCYFAEPYSDVDETSFEEIIDDIMKNWKGGGNYDKSYLKRILDEGWAKNFTINLTDGWIDDYTTPGSETYDLASEVFDPSNLIWGIIFPKKTMRLEDWEHFVDRFPGDKVPIFLESKAFDR